MFHPRRQQRPWSSILLLKMQRKAQESLILWVKSFHEHLPSKYVISCTSWAYIIHSLFIFQKPWCIFMYFMGWIFRIDIKVTLHIDFTMLWRARRISRYLWLEGYLDTYGYAFFSGVAIRYLWLWLEGSLSLSLSLKKKKTQLTFIYERFLIDL